MVARLFSIVILIVMLIGITANKAFCIGPQDTLRTDTGEIIPIPDPGICGVDYADSQFVASLKSAYFNLPPGQTEAPLDSCSVESALRSLLQSHYVYYVEQVFTGAQLYDTLRVVGADTVMVPDLSHIFLLRQQASCDVLAAVEDLYSHSATRFAEPNCRGSVALVPNDPYWKNRTLPQWNLQDIGYGIGCPIAWDETPGSSDVRLGIIDTGVNYNHLDLGGFGYPNDKIVGGYDLADGDDYPLDFDGHGTAVTGIAGALTNNSRSIAGISGGWNAGDWDTGADIYAFKIYTDGGVWAGAEVVARAYKLAVDPNGDYACHIINHSGFVPGAYAQVIMPKILFAYKVAANIVACKKNQPSNQIWYPAECPYRNWVIGVAGYGLDGKFCDGDFSCGYTSDDSFGIDIVAPAWQIPSTNIDGGISAFGGNSTAVPHVSGAVALLRSINNALKPEDYEGILNYSADDPVVPESDGSVWTWHKRYGHGRLKISTAVTRLTSPAWQLAQHTATGGYVFEIITTTYRFIPPTDVWPGNSEYIDGSYAVHRYEVRVNVSYPQPYLDVPYVWGLGEGPVGERTIGWSAADPNYQVGWCDLVPNTQRINGCVLRTYVYLLAGPGRDITWYPCAPEDVELQYRLWGQPGLAPPKFSGEEMPLAISFNGNYPNPFNVSTVLRYELSQSAQVDISIYNIIGQRVATLFDGYQSAGEYDLTWNAGDFPSGVYFAQFKARDFEQSVKLVLLK